jgi:hypothetical protein
LLAGLAFAFLFLPSHFPPYFFVAVAGVGAVLELQLLRRKIFR